MPIVLAGLALVLVAVLGMLLLSGYEQFAKATSQLVPDWHIPGFGSPRQWWNAAAGALGASVAGVFAYSLGPLAHLIQVPVRWLQKHLSGWLAAGVAVLHVLTYLRTSLIPWVLNAAITRANQLYLAARAYAASLVTELRTLLSAVETRLLNLVSAVELRVLALLAAAVAGLHALVSAVELRLLGLLSAVESRLLALVSAVELRLLGLLSAVESRLLALVSAVVAELRTELAVTKAWLIAYCDATVARVVNAALANEHVLLGRALAATWPRALDEIDQVIAAADTDFAAALANLRGLRGLSLANPFAVVGALAGVLTGLLRFTRDCTIPNCRNLSQVGRDLQELFAVVEGEALIGLLVAAAHDPGGVGRAALDVAAPLITDAADGIRGQVAA